MKDLNDREAAVEQRLHQLSDQQLRWLKNQFPSTSNPSTIPNAHSSQLHAFVVLSPSDDAATSTEELQNHLQDRLPGYMLPHAVTLLHQIPTLTNGKVDLAKLRELETVPETTGSALIEPRNEVEQKLADIWCALLDLEVVGVNDNFFELGGDSILSIQLVSRAREAGLKLEPKDITLDATITSLSKSAGMTTAALNADVEQTGKIPLTPIQNWFFHSEHPHPEHWNQARLIKVAEPYNPEVLEKTIHHLVQRHDAFRLRFTKTLDGWDQQIASVSETPMPFQFVRLDNLPQLAWQDAVRSLAEREQQSLNLQTGRLARFCLIELPDGTQLLLIVMHHLICDAVSWALLDASIQDCYESILNGKDVNTRKQTSFGNWAARLAERTSQFEEQTEYWIAQHSQIDNPHTVVTHQETNAIRTSTNLAPQLSENALIEAAEKYHCSTQDILIASYLESLRQTFRFANIQLGLESHGRNSIFDDIDLSETLGWLTSYYPLRFALPEANQKAEVIKYVKEQLRSVPDGGIGYGVLRYMAPRSRAHKVLNDLKEPFYLFNFLGKAANYEGILDRDLCKPISRHPENNRAFALEFNASINVDGTLQIHAIGSPMVFSQDNLHQYADCFEQELQSIIEHCHSRDAIGFTPSDFPNAGLDQADLDAFLDSVDEND